MGFFSKGETYRRTLTRGDEKLEVELRPLMAGDRADLQDQLRIVVGDDDADSNVLQMRPGTSRILTVVAAVVSWNLEIVPSENAIRALEPDVLDWLFAEVSWGTIPTEPTEKETTGDPLDASKDSSASSATDEPALADSIS